MRPFYRFTVRSALGESAKFLASVAVLLATLSATGVYAQGTPDKPYRHFNDIPEILVEYLNRAEFRDAAISNALQIIRNNGEDRRRLTTASVQAQKDREARERRKRALQEVIPFDVNLDGQITRDELVEVITVERNSIERTRQSRMDITQIEQQIKQQVSRMMRYDTNADGKISLQEAANYTGREEHHSGSSTAEQMEKLLALDIDGDGALTDEEFVVQVGAAFSLLDIDGDGRLTEEERKPMKDRLRARQEAARIDRMTMGKCVAPAPAANEMIAVLTASQGGAYTTVSLDGPGEPTYGTTVEIGETKKRVYLALAGSAPIVWNLTGRTEALSRVVVFGPQNRESVVLAAIKGVPREKVTFLPVETCLPSFASEMRGNINAPLSESAKFLTHYFKRAPDVIQKGGLLYQAGLGGDGFFVVRQITKGRLAKPLAGFDAEVWASLVEKEQYDLMPFVPKELITQARAEYYPVLPGGYGLSKMAHDGVLEKLPAGRYMRVTPESTHLHTPRGSTETKRADVMRVTNDPNGVRIFNFRLKRSIEFWPAVSGGQKIYVPAGVSLPSNFPMDECREEKGKNGERVFGVHC